MKHTFFGVMRARAHQRAIGVDMHQLTRLRVVSQHYTVKRGDEHTTAKFHRADAAAVAPDVYSLRRRRAVPHDNLKYAINVLVIKIKKTYMCACANR